MEVMTLVVCAIGKDDEDKVDEEKDISSSRSMSECHLSRYKPKECRLIYTAFNQSK